ncbi:MAG: PIN domain-containing protein [Deltaproteobacteria bacterium]|nr:PIN domain-containing protein [Deltaproteobacteria bacterium]
MAPHGLIDTGAILALLKRNDPWHEPCAQAFARIAVPLATSAAVLAELFHLLRHHRRDVATAWGFLRSGVITIAPIVDTDMSELETLMARYRDRPMDFAHATLVHLAHRESLTTILTIDHDDFETYRIGRRQRFRILPERRLFH